MCSLHVGGYALGTPFETSVVQTVEEIVSFLLWCDAFAMPHGFHHTGRGESVTSAFSVNSCVCARGQRVKVREIRGGRRGKGEAANVGNGLG